MAKAHPVKTWQSLQDEFRKSQAFFSTSYVEKLHSYDTKMSHILNTMLRDDHWIWLPKNMNKKDLTYRCMHLTQFVSDVDLTTIY